MRRVIIYILLFVSLAARGQDVLSEAQSAFDMGRFEQSDSLLLNNLQLIKGDAQVTAFRLLALSSLNQDRPEDAEMYIGRLLGVDPYYTAYGENPRFLDILERLKKGKTIITTASKIEESTEEVPVPVTLITEEMIQASGARTLNELLMLYVPGLSSIGSIEDNVAMRGVYGLTQEHMLVMLNGHRLNSFSTNTETMDFRQNLDKIKQIEVLRGPASSLYGNVALTAVVNIITKSGSELEGASVIGRAGLNNSYGGTLLFGQGNLRSDVFAWASLYSSQGEVRWENGTKHYIGGYSNKPAYDLGVNIRWGDLKISAIGQHAKTVPYYNLIQIGNYFTYDKYPEQNGEKPGASRDHMRVDLDYSHSFGNFSLSASAFATTERVQIYNIMGDTLNQMWAMLALVLMDLNDELEPHSRGVWQCFNWEDYCFGGSVNAAYKYRFSDKIYGSLVGGVQYEYFKLIDGGIKLGYDFDQISYMTNSVLKKGDEQMVSAFVQLKNYFTKKLILNGGVRFDHKVRNDGRKINTISPRIALIYIPNNVLSIKGTFAHSFVDAPILYRVSTINLFRGSENMNPQQMDAFQIGASLNIKPINLKYELNLFYNNVYDLVFYTSTDLNTNDIFENAGRISIGGVENVLQYSTSKTLVNLNLTYQYPFRVENFSSTNHNISNVPKFMLNLVASQQIFATPRIGSFRLRANMHFQSAIECLDNDFSHIGDDTEKGFVTLPQSAYAVFGAGMEWRLPFKLTASFDTYNLFNKRYAIGGKLMQGNPGQGFSFIGRLRYDF